MERTRRPPSDVEEALSSMLWTPYQRTPTDSSSDDDDDFTSCTGHDKSSAEKLTTSKKRISNISDLYAGNITTISDDIIGNTSFFNSNSFQCSNIMPTYGKFLPKSYNNRNLQLPTYEHVEKERGCFNVNGGFGSRESSNSNRSIYLVPSSYTKCTMTSSSTMVHSFTDDFTHYQVTKGSNSKIFITSAIRKLTFTLFNNSLIRSKNTTKMDINKII